ncbi:MAG: glycine cleavage system protein H [Candidatus Riflebacteria bacterium]|nr:glycine cleavage system protein H [Candidatus Riflebacteria bacterium]
MAILLLIAMLSVLIVAHFLFGRGPLAEPAPRHRQLAQAQSKAPAHMVEGFEMPDYLRYHPGHTWVLAEGPKYTRAGVDQFAARLMGKIEGVVLPQRGRWIRQGQKAWTLVHNGQKIDMVSPIEGIVTDVNEALLADPDLVRRDPYGAGWLMSVEAPDAKTVLRNLLGGTLAHKWMEDASARLRSRLPALAGAVAQDGGPAVEDLSTCIPEQEWGPLVRELCLDQ